MAAPAFCSSCGRSLAPGAAFCTFCGARPGVPGSAPPLAGAPPTYYAPQQVIYTPVTPMPSLATAPTDRRALLWVEVAAAFSLVAAALSVVELLQFGFGRGLVSTNTTAGAQAFHVTIPSWFYAFTAASAVAEILTFLCLRFAFVELRAVDHRFDSPATLALLALIAFPIVLLGTVLLLQGLAGSSCTNPSGANPGGCSFGAGFGGGLALTLIGAILALIGVIGVLIGLWRVGTRYNQEMMHLAVILAILPFLQIVGWILILVGSDSARRRAGSLPPPAF